MRKGKPGLRAFLISGAIHCAVLVLAAWMGLLIFEAPQAEQYLELELVQDASLPGAAATAEKSVNNAGEEGKPVAEAEAAAARWGGQPSAAAAAGGSAGGAAVSRAAGQAGDKAENVSKRIQLPRILRQVKPVYPEEMRQEEVAAAGQVILRVEVLENGDPGKVTVKSTSGHPALDEAAVQAVGRWRFLPAKDEATGRAVRCYIALPVVFDLKRTEGS